MATLRYKALKSGKYSIYTETYDTKTQKRIYEFLKLYVTQDYSKSLEIKESDLSILKEAYKRLGISNPINELYKSNKLIGFIRTKFNEKPKTYKCLLNYLEKHTKGKDIELIKINTNWLEGFKLFLRKQDLTESSVQCYLLKLRSVINILEKEKLINCNPFNDFEVKAIKNEAKDYLTKNQTDELKQLPFPFHQQYKDAFLFSLYSGLKLKNIKNLTKSNIIYKTGKNNAPSLKFDNHKSSYTVELNNNAIEILLKYTGQDKDRIFDKLHQLTSLHQVLKLWGIMARLSFELKFSCARNTFAYNLIQKGGDLKTLQQKLAIQNSHHAAVYIEMIK